jgi:hypothetical protein
LRDPENNNSGFYKTFNTLKAMNVPITLPEVENMLYYEWEFFLEDYKEFKEKEKEAHDKEEAKYKSKYGDTDSNSMMRQAMSSMPKTGNISLPKI